MLACLSMSGCPLQIPRAPAPTWPKWSSRRRRGGESSSGKPNIAVRIFARTTLASWEELWVVMPAQALPCQCGAVMLSTECGEQCIRLVSVGIYNVGSEHGRNDASSLHVQKQNGSGFSCDGDLHSSIMAARGHKRRRCRRPWSEDRTARNLVVYRCAMALHRCQSRHGSTVAV